MKKLIVLFSILLMVVLTGTLLAATSNATLINSYGDKVVVAVGSSEAQSYFAKGYVLLGTNLVPPICPACDKVIDDIGATISDVYNRVTIHDKLIDGGKVLNASTTLTIAKTLTAKNICDNNVITVNSAATAAATLAAASLDITLPATSTLFSTCLKEEGSHLSFIFANLSPTAASTTQIVAGAGMDLMEPDDSSAFDVEIAGGARAVIDIWRMPKGFESNLDAVVSVMDMSAAD